jgi:starch phosphorylase
LVEEIVPAYYSASDEGVPVEWVRVMKAAIKSTAAQFSARRMVKKYVEKYYAEALKLSMIGIN